MSNGFFEFVRSLVPPDKDEDPRPWRRSVFWALLSIIVVLTFHLVSVKGYLSSIGISPVASAAEVQIIDQRSKSILYAIYSPQVRAKIRERCDTQDRHEREVINMELDRLLKEYRDAAGERFDPMPTCAQV